MIVVNLLGFEAIKLLLFFNPFIFKGYELTVLIGKLQKKSLAAFINDVKKENIFFTNRKTQKIQTIL